MSQLRRLTNTKQKSRKSRWIKGKLKIIHNSNMKLNFAVVFISVFAFTFFMLWGNIIRILSHIDCETSKMSSQDKKKEEPTKRVRVLCWIMTHPANHKIRVRILKSWLFHFHQNNHVKHFVIWILKNRRCMWRRPGVDDVTNFCSSAQKRTRWSREHL